MSIRSKVKHGKVKLVVVRFGPGFILAGQHGDKSLTRFGQQFPLQKQAIAEGEAKFGQAPSVVRLKKAS